MKELAKFIGKVNSLNSPPADSFVTLREMFPQSGKVVETVVISSKLIEAGLEEGDEFEVIVNQSIDNKITAEIHKLNPIPLSQERIKEICKEVDDKLGNIDNIFSDEGSSI